MIDRPDILRRIQGAFVFFSVSFTAMLIWVGLVLAGQWLFLG